MHSPDVEQESAVPAGRHAPQDEPFAPHADSDSSVHTWPTQQPSGHDVASHTQAPPEQCRPWAQGSLVPHWHVPPLPQRSVVVALQLMQEAPATPQVVGVLCSHVVPLQQPSAHEVESQRHLPETHACPAAHAEPLPHVHWPAAEQPSATIVSHEVQALPGAPHIETEGISQVRPVQHPPGHMQLLHAPPLHVSPVLHVAQTLPALPHWLTVSPVSHVLPLQQPVGHEVASQVHCPETQCCPEPHAGPEPHWQLPETLQPSLVVAVHPVQTHVPPMQVLPGAHGRPLPHEGPRLP